MYDRRTLRVLSKTGGEIDRTFHRRLREVEELNPGPSSGSENFIPAEGSLEVREIPIMAGRRLTLSEYERSHYTGEEFSVHPPNVNMNNFEIKPSTMTMIQNTAQFDGRPDEDPHAHIAKFVQICNMFKINGASDDAIRLRLFPFSLREGAYRSLTLLPSGSIRTWAEMLDKFLGRYFPPSKAAKLRLDISSFKQGPNESFYEAYERYKDLLRRCPQHGIDDCAKSPDLLPWVG
ncbi:hypothetical protein J5N97_020613 [Dioscorea zingiberensis]|uniref:Retrotransposon gag domain-containing protein n=1 Tax=Dioscorea zingiberensis TaxID=325984 RepID=A0A9D5CGR1_9LILI|nr:hypothetical protein J5N97_020613 [Dioscorea zingiberensis]